MMTTWLAVANFVISCAGRVRSMCGVLGRRRSNVLEEFKLYEEVGTNSALAWRRHRAYSTRQERLVS